MFRKLGIGLTALAMLAPGFASALGVGDYRLNSYLNQPLNMEVELIDVGDLTPEELLVNLGGEREFQNAGVERVFFLNELNFEVELKPNGDGVLRITTNQPVREPFLNFIIEVMWPTGRLLREYTVLLDPPSFVEPVSRPVAPPAAVQPVAPAPAQTVAPAQPSSQPRVVAQSRDYDTRRGPDYVVQNSDTLWRIALNNRPVTSISVQQMLIAIQQLNPDAFIDGNVNLVREGTVLRMPTEEEIRSISARNAIAQVAEQNREWRAKLEARGIALPSRTQLDGTGTGRTGRATGGVSEGQVTLLSPDAVSGTGTGRGTAGTGTADASALQNELAIRDENMDRMNRENRELSSRLKDLQDQVATSERLLKLRNDQIAQLQQQLNELQKAQGLTPSEPIVIEPVEEAPVAVISEDEAAVVDGESAALAEGEAVAEDEAASEPAVAEVAPVVVPERPSVVVPPVPAPAPTLMDTLMANLLYILAGVLVLAAVVGGMVFMRNRQKAGQVEEEFAEGDESDAGDDDFFAAAQDFGDDEEQDEDAAAAPESAQDPLEEVDVYTAYGRHAEAVNFLRNEIHKAPQRDDLKVRLLEVLTEMHDRDGFEREAAGFAGAGASVAAAISSLRGRLGGGEQEPSLDDLEMDLASDFDAPVIKPSAPAPAAEEELSLGDDDDFGSLDFSLDDDKPASAAPVLAAEEELSLDLGGDDELSLDMGSDDSMSLDDDGLSLDLDGDKTTASAALNLDDDDGLELSLDDDDGELSLDIDDAPAVTSKVALDDISTDLSDDVDFGEVSLTDVSDEFSEAAVKPSAEEIDLSLDDLSLDELEEPTAVSLPAVEPTATVQRDALELDADELSLDDEPTLTSAPVAVPAASAAPAALEQALTGDDDDFDFLGDTDENATKLDLAKAYIDMGDSEGARDILQEVVSEGNPQQQQEAKELLAQVG